MQQKSRILPIHSRAPLAATLGVMLYPDIGESEREKAHSFTRWQIIQALEVAQTDGIELSKEDLSLIESGPKKPPFNYQYRYSAGLWAGELLKTYLTLSMSHNEIASWESAIKIAVKSATKNNAPASRSRLYDKLSKFNSVVHLWAALSIRKNRFSCHQEIGYTYDIDFQFFLEEAENIRKFSTQWRPKRDKAPPPISKPTWRLPDDWQAPERKAGWPKTGVIPVMSLNNQMRDGLRRAGRPKNHE